MLFLLLFLFFLFFPFLVLFSIFSFPFSLFFCHRFRSTQRRYVAGLFHDFFVLFIFSFFSFFLFIVSLKRRNIVLLFLFECFSNLFSTKRFSLYQVSVPGIIPSSLYLGLGPAGSRKKPCNRSWRSYSFFKNNNNNNNNNIIIGKIFQISLSNSGANRIGLHQL